MTRTLLVAYDLTLPSETRPRIAEMLMSIGEAWARPLDTVWMLRTHLAPEQIEARLAPLLAGDDGLMIQEARGDAAFANTGLRWFRPRRSTAAEALQTAAVLAFRDSRQPGDDCYEQAA